MLLSTAFRLAAGEITRKPLRYSRAAIARARSVYRLVEAHAAAELFRKAAPGQKSLFDDAPSDPEFEAKHPREGDGTFALKGEGEPSKPHDDPVSLPAPSELSADESRRYKEYADLMGSHKMDARPAHEWAKDYREAQARHTKGKADVLEKDRGPAPAGSENGPLAPPAGKAIEPVGHGKAEPAPEKRPTGGLPDSPGSERAGTGIPDGSGGGGPAGGGVGSPDGPAATGPGGPGQSVRGRSAGSDRGVSGGRAKRPRKPTAENPTDLAAGNWRYATRDFFKGGKKAKFHNNIRAIQTLRAIQAEGRTAATPEEQEALSKYVGWGAFPELFSYDSEWEKERGLFKALLPDSADREAAHKSTINAHFTHPDVVDAHWQILRRLGFKGGRFLEPSVGSGYYLGMMPPEVAGRTKTVAVELDTTTAAIAKLLYPSATVLQEGFQDHKSPDNFYDVVASNVPFAAAGPHDPRYNKYHASLHDYFFLKSADLTRPGGVVAHITSTGTMDKPAGENVRRKLAEDCDLLGAIRFPGSTHEENAGTEVVTDMLILRKRPAGQKPPPMDQTPQEAQPGQPGFTGVTTDSLGRVYHWVDGKRVPADHWVETGVHKLADGQDSTINNYWATHPEQVLGTLDHTGTMYRGGQLNVSKTDDYQERLERAIAAIPEGLLEKSDPTEPAEAAEPIRMGEKTVKPGGYAIGDDGAILIRQGDGLVPAKVGQEAGQRIAGMIGIRDAAFNVIEQQRTGQDDDAAQAELNRVYDAFVAKYGPLNAAENKRAIKGDPDSHFLKSLEKWDKKAEQATKTDLFSKDTVRPSQHAERAENVTDALGISLFETASIDIDRMAALLDRDQDEIGAEMVKAGLAYEDPASGWQPAAAYLSGNVRKKLAAAQQAAEIDHKYRANVEALLKVQPEDIPADEIGVRLGSHWIPGDDIKEFARFVTGGSSADVFECKYVPETGEWVFGFTDNAAGRNAAKRAGVAALSTERVPFGKIMHHALNGGTIEVNDKDSDGKYHKNIQAMQDAAQKVQELKEHFGQWIWDDDDRRSRLHRFYNDNFNNIREMEFDGSHLTFPGMIPGFQMRDIQKNFVWRVLTTGRGLAAHEVGTGKTASMVAAAMELRRMGLARKPVISCLKANIDQITREAYELYPGAKILSTADNFDADKRQATIAAIATGDWDLVIMSHENMEMMPMDPAVVQQYIREEVSELNAAIDAAEAANPGKKNNRVVKALAAQKLKLEERLKKSLDEANKDRGITFEQSGIDMLMVDEAHNFKTLPVSSSENIKGIPTGRSDKATDLLMRTRWLQRQNGGRGVVFATGTPVSNTMAELYNMQRYLMPDELKERGVDKFDAWRNAFGDTKTRTEFTTAGNYAQVSRFSQFTNIPELMQLTGQVVDVERVADLKKPDGSPAIVRPKKFEHAMVSPQTPAIAKMMEGIRKRAMEVKANPYNTKDNMLSICDTGKKGSIDLRLLDPTAPDDPSSKANQCVRQVLKNYKEGPAGSTQAIFSDIGVHEVDNGFHLFGDLKKKLIAGGIPADQIADFGELKGEARDAAQDGLRRGTVRIALGSTKRLGTGTNIQKKLYAVHHLDCPYVPAYIEQRDGRAWRHGNFNDPSKPANEQNVHIYKYVAEGTLDQTFWQIVATKAAFINQVMGGKSHRGGARTAAEIDTETMTPDEMMAAASGDSRIVQRVMLEQERRELLASEAAHNRSRANKSTVVSAKKSEADRLGERAKLHKQDAEHLSKRPDFHLVLEGHGSYTERGPAGDALKAKAEEADNQFDRNEWHRQYADPEPIGQYRGLPLSRTPDGAFQLEGPSGHTYKTGDSLASIETVARKIAADATKAEQERAGILADLERLQSKEGGEWPKAAKLKEVTEKLRALDAELRHDKGDKKEPPAEKYRRLRCHADPLSLPEPLSDLAAMFRDAWGLAS